MNYYSHHIGDFDRATRHLTRLERSIYRDLIDVYYDTEQYLTLDLVALCRKVIALSNEEATTVERMLNEFFVRTPDGWMHHRCQEEIGKYHAKAEQASRAGKASAAKRTFNGRSTDVQPTNNQEPITNNHKPKKEAKASSVASFDAPDWFPASQWSDFIKMRKAMKSVPFTEAACKGVIREVEKLCKQGHDAANLLETAVMNGWRTVYPPKTVQQVKSWADNKADVAHMTVPGTDGVDPALAKILADEKRAAPMPDYVRQAREALKVQSH